MQMRGFVKLLPTMAKGLFFWFVLHALCNFSSIQAQTHEQGTEVCWSYHHHH